MQHQWRTSSWRGDAFVGLHGAPSRTVCQLCLFSGIADMGLHHCRLLGDRTDRHVNAQCPLPLCVMVYRCLHGIGPEYFSEDFKLVSEIQSRQRLRSASSTDVVVPATRRSSLGDRASQSQELERGTHCRPVTPPHHLCPHSGDS